VVFDEKCAKVNEEKNAARERTIQIKTRGAINAFKLARMKERQLDEEALDDRSNHKWLCVEPRTRNY
jgi:hypothetical protein